MKLSIGGANARLLKSFASKDQSDPNFCRIHVHGGRAYATDGYRMAIVKVDEGVEGSINARDIKVTKREVVLELEPLDCSIDFNRFFRDAKYSASPELLMELTPALESGAEYLIITPRALVVTFGDFVSMPQALVGDYGSWCVALSLLQDIPTFAFAKVASTETSLYLSSETGAVQILVPRAVLDGRTTQVARAYSQYLLV